MNPYIRELVKIAIIKEQIPKLENAIDLLYINYCIKPIQYAWRKNKYLIKKRKRIANYHGSIYHMKICEICGYKIVHIPGFVQLNIREYLNCGCEFYGNKLRFTKYDMDAHIEYNLKYSNLLR